MSEADTSNIGASMLRMPPAAEEGMPSRRYSSIEAWPSLISTALLDAVGEEIPPEVRDAASLTAYAHEARYPTLAPPTSSEEQVAVASAEAVVRWTETRLESFLALNLRPPKVVTLAVESRRSRFASRRSTHLA